MDSKNLNDYKSIGTRIFYKLQAGDIFKAVIQNIRPNEVTIQFSGGELYTARSMVLPEARIGEESLFCVQENDFEGRIVLKMVKLDSEIRKTKMLADVLANAKIPATPEMLELAHAIIDNGLPADASTLQKASLLLMSQEMEIPEIIESLLKDLPAVQKNIPPPERFTFDMRV